MATREQPKDFGRYLQACRIGQGISLEAVSRMTRITKAVLKQIESEDLAQLPAPVFVKGFLKAYAEEVGADKDEVLARYEAGLQTVRKLKPAQTSREKPRSFLPRILLSLVLVAVVIGGTLYLSSLYLTESEKAPEEPPTIEPAHEAETSTAETPSTETPTAETPSSRTADAEEPSAQVAAPEEKTETAPQAEDNATPEEGEAPVQITSLPEQTAESVPEQTPALPEEKERLALKLVAVEPTWIKIIADDQVPQEFSMDTGDTLRLEAQDRFNLLIGNASGVQLTFNGKPVVVPGKSGQVVTLQLP